MEIITEYIPKHSSYLWSVRDLNRIGYKEALEMQEDLWQRVVDGDHHYLLLLEHNPVITLGKRTDPDHLLKTKQELEQDGIELFEVNRGGSATYHGPGQVVGYIICKSSRIGGIHALVEKTLIGLSNTISSLGISCTIDYENPGIWTTSDPPRKLAAVGMSNRNGVTMHGFAVNVDVPLTGFSMIVPCGLQLPVSTLSIELGTQISIAEFKKDVIDHLLAQWDQNIKDS